MLPKDIAKLVPKTHLMSESEWRNLGVQQSQGWVHYMIHEPGWCNGRFIEGMLDPITQTRGSRGRFTGFLPHLPSREPGVSTSKNKSKMSQKFRDNPSVKASFISDLLRGYPFFKAW